MVPGDQDVSISSKKNREKVVNKTKTNFVRKNSIPTNVVSFCFLFLGGFALSDVVLNFISLRQKFVPAAILTPLVTTSRICKFSTFGEIDRFRLALASPLSAILKSL